MNNECKNNQTFIIIRSLIICNVSKCFSNTSPNSGWAYSVMQLRANNPKQQWTESNLRFYFGFIFLTVINNLGTAHDVIFRSLGSEFAPPFYVISNWHCFLEATLKNTSDRLQHWASLSVSVHSFWLITGEKINKLVFMLI